MANITLSQFTQEELTEVANNILNVYTNCLVTENILTQEQADKCLAYRVVICKNTMWSKFWKFFRPDTSPGLIINIVKMTAITHD